MSAKRRDMTFSCANLQPNAISLSILILGKYFEENDEGVLNVVCLESVESAKRKTVN